MTKEKAKYAVEVMQAYIDGKEIEYFSIEQNEWCSVDVPIFDWSIFNYRIKQETKYRPFKNKEECWNEMLKHQPFGWTHYGNAACYENIICIVDNGVYYDNETLYGYEDLLNNVTFIDGIPFGIKEE